MRDTGARRRHTGWDTERLDSDEEDFVQQLGRGIVSRFGDAVLGGEGGGGGGAIGAAAILALLVFAMPTHKSSEGY